MSSIQKELLKALRDAVEEHDENDVVERSIKAKPAVVKAGEEQDKLKAEMRKEFEEVTKNLVSMAERAKVSHQKFWAIVGTEMGLWGDRHMKYNSETKEIEIIAD
jgi:hypothetical protein